MKNLTTDPLAEERRETLNSIIGDAPVATFWRDHGLGELGISENYFRQLLSGNRNIGDKTARKIEGAIGRTLAIKPVANELKEPAGVYQSKSGSPAGKLLRRLSDIEAAGRLSSSLIRAINSMLDATATATTNQQSDTAYALVNAENRDEDLGLGDDPVLTDLSEHLKSALDTLQLFRERNIQIPAKRKRK